MNELNYSITAHKCFILIHRCHICLHGSLINMTNVFFRYTYIAIRTFKNTEN